MKNTYITWHYTTHGVAFLKHILSEFYLLGKIPPSITLQELSQSELNEVFDKPKKKGGFLFDKVVYLTATQNAHDKISSRRFAYKKTILEDSLILESGLKEVYEQLVEADFSYNLEKEIAFVKRKFPKEADVFISLLWRNIQHYPVTEQLKWLKEYSNFKHHYFERFEVVEINIDNLKDEKLLADKVGAWSRNYFSKQKDTQYFINVALGSSETQVVWHILAELGQLPKETRFIKTFDDKNNNPKERFKNFAIQEVPTNLISEINAEFPIYKETKSAARQLVNLQMNSFLKSGFSILLIGERGIGKTQIADMEKNRENRTFPFEEANCAAFENNDNKAEAAFFGVEKGTFTDVLPSDGLMLKANGGILFLDEFHHLSKPVQAKLMKAFSTDKDNFMTVQKLGNSKPVKVKIQLIFATNKSIDELRTLLLPDFYDRVVQHVVQIPSLRKTAEDRVADWIDVWNGLFDKKKPKPPVPTDSKLISWLRKQKLYGNYRDLQKIAMYYNVFTEFEDATKEMINETTPYDYAIAEFEKYHSIEAMHENVRFNFNENQTTKQMIADYLYELQDWAVKRFGGRKTAVEHFMSLGDSDVTKSLNNWKNRTMLKDKA